VFVRQDVQQDFGIIQDLVVLAIVLAPLVMLELALAVLLAKGLDI